VSAEKPQIDTLITIFTPHWGSNIESLERYPIW